MLLHRFLCPTVSILFHFFIACTNAHMRSPKAITRHSSNRPKARHPAPGVVPKEDALDALLPWLPTEDLTDDVSPTALQGAIANIARATRRYAGVLTSFCEFDWTFDGHSMAAPALQDRLQPLLMAGLRRAFDSREPAVRRAVVLCLVDMWRTLGDVLAPMLADLKPTQHRLVQVYMDRASQQQPQRVRWFVVMLLHV